MTGSQRSPTPTRLWTSTFFLCSPRSQTPGKRALSIRVISFPDGGYIGYWRAFVRWGGRIVSALAIFIGYLWMLWDRERQTWHDKLASARRPPRPHIRHRPRPARERFRHRTENLKHDNDQVLAEGDLAK